MAAKQLILVALSAAMLTACGGSPTTGVTPQASTDPSVLSTDDSSLIGGDPGGALDTSASDAIDPTATPTPASIGNGFVLKGLVTDAIGKPLQAAKISIGSQTTLSAADGTFEIDGIMDSQVQVAVTLDGYQPIPAYVINFSTDSPTADKEFQLADAGTAGTTTGTTTGGTTTGGTTTTTPSSTAGFTLQGTFTPEAFTSVSSMIVDGDITYVLGVVKGLLLSYNTVVEMSSTNGAEIRKFNKTGLLTHIPKTATFISLSAGQVNVSDGASAYVFGTDGTLIKKVSGGASSNTTKVTDTTRSLTYKLVTGSRVEVTDSSNTTIAYQLPDATQALSIGLDSNGDLLVLDGVKAGVLQYTFTK